MAVTKDCVWITWETQIRNMGLARSFGCEYVEFNYDHFNRLFRYLACIVLTVRLLLRNRYRCVFAQCPSIALVGVVGLIKPLRGYTFVIDAHNALFDYSRSYWPLRWFARFCCRRADFVLVTNGLLVDEVRELGSQAVILPDPLPEVGNHPLPDRFDTGQKHTITFICSFHADEPIEEFLLGMRGLPEGFRVFVTGRSDHSPIPRRFQGEPIVFTGYVTRREYDGLIRSSDLLVDLTTLSDCIVCGAYEALAVGVPALLSNHQPLRDLFHKGFLFADNAATSYRECVDRFFEQPEFYRAAIVELRNEFAVHWAGLFEKAYSRIFPSSAHHALDALHVARSEG